MIEVVKKQNLYGNLNADGDKSITIRAVILGALAKGKTVILNPLISADTLASIDCVKKLGAVVIKKQNSIEIIGAKKLNSGCELDCKNSGTLARFLIGALAGACVEATIVGDESLSNRPMDRVCNPLVERGAKIISNNGKLPVRIYPANLSEFTYKMPIDSAQVKSAILLSGVTSGKKTIVFEKNFTRDHTEKMIAYFGGDIIVNQKEIILNKSELAGREIEVPADPSSSAFYLTLGLCLGEITVKNVLLSKARSGFFDKVLQAGGKLVYTNKYNLGIFETCNVTAYKSTLNYFEVEGFEIPSLIDEIPLLALLGAVNNGCVIKDAKELKVKESDRFNETVKLLTSCGVECETRENDLIIKSAREFKSFEYKSDDHRMIMTAFCASTIKVNAKIYGEESANVSFPSFYKNYYNCMLGLIGKNVQNSFSGSIHKFILNTCNAENFTYEQRSIYDDDFEEFLKKCGYKAFNATSPFKERLVNIIKNQDLIASNAGSINFVCYNKAYSTDGAGLLLSLKQRVLEVKNKSVLVYGIGGAGKAIAVALKDAGAKVYVTNRTSIRAEEFCKNRTDINLFNGEICDILINATTNKDDLLFSENLLKNCSLVIDINYRQSLALEKWANENKKPFINGFAMLFYQAYICDMILLGKMPNEKQAFKLFNEYRKNYEN